MSELGAETCAQSTGTGGTGGGVGQRSLKRDAQPSGKGRWALGALPAPPAGGQAPRWHAGAVALPSSSSSPAARGEMVGMPNHLGRCDQIALLKGAKPV